MANPSPDEMVIVDGVRYQPGDAPKPSGTDKVQTAPAQATPTAAAKEAPAPRNKARTTADTPTKEG